MHVACPGTLVSPDDPAYSLHRASVMKLAIVTNVFLFAVLAGLVAGPAKLEETLKLPAHPPEAGTNFAILLTGDGGWAELVRTIGVRLDAADIPTVGWDLRAYFWTRRTPDEAAKDLARLLERFRKEWNRPRVVLVGYSRGADLLPFLVNRLPEVDRQTIELIALLGPAHNTNFEIHLGDFLGETKSKTALPVVPEIMKLKGLPLLVLYGDDDPSSCGSVLPRELGDIRSIPGGHHFDRDYPRVIQPILDSIAKRKRQAAPLAAAGGPSPP